MKNTISFFMICLLLLGCTSISNISKDSGFSNFLGNEIVLKKQVLVCKDEPLKIEDGSSITHKLLYNVNLITKCPFGETIGLLPAGSTLRIEKIEKHKIFTLKTATHIYFIGRTVLPGGAPFRFYYLYGHEGFYDDQPW